MTIIAYKAGIMAADTLCSSGGLKVGQVKKLAKNKRGDLMGCSGASGWCQAMIRWFVEGEEDPMPFVPQEATGEDTGKAMIVRVSAPQQAITLYSNPRNFPDEITVSTRQGIACGSGRAEAMGAMHAGANAIQAVEAAMDLDDNCGGSVDWNRLGWQ